MPEKLQHEFWIKCKREQEANMIVSKLEWCDYIVSLSDFIRAIILDFFEDVEFES